MDYRSKSDGWQTFSEHWGFLVSLALVVVTSQVLGFFTGLHGESWIWCFGFGLSVAAVGATLIFYAKLPLYRQRRFITFGSQALPQNKRSFYRWGYRCTIFAVVLLLWLFLSRP
jgi:hypothetical protein